MQEHFDLVASRLRNLVARITARDPDFDDICKRHAALTTQIRTLHSNTDPVDADRDQALRRSRAALEEQMLAIMQANTRV